MGIEINMREKNDKAKEKLLMGKIDEALKLYLEVLDQTPENADALFGASVCHFYKKNFLEAIALSDKAISIDLKQGLFHTVKANSYYELGEMEKSKFEADTAYILSPKSPEVIACKGSLYLYDNKISESIRLLEEAICINEDFYDAHFYLALAYNLSKNHWKFLRELLAIFRLKPSIRHFILILVQLANNLHPIPRIISILMIVIFIINNNWIFLIYPLFHLMIEICNIVINSYVKTGKSIL